MRLAVVLLLVLVSGCVASPQAARVDPATAIPIAPQPFTYLACAGDLLEPLEGDHDDGCNTRVTIENGPAAEVSLAVNPLDPLNLVGGAKDFTLGEDARCGKYNVWSGVYWTRDGGRTWGNGLLPGYPGDPRITPLSDYACGSDPVLAFGADGVAYYASIHVTLSTAERTLPPQTAPVTGYDAINSALAVTRSRDGGETWDDPVLLVTRDDGAIIDKEWIAIDQRTGAIYVTFIVDGVLQIMRSDDAGATWTAPTAIAGGDTAVQFGQVGVAPDGIVHFVYWGTRQTQDDASAIYHVSSSDRGESWSAPTRVARFVPILDLEVTHRYRIVTLPALAIDASSGALYVAYPAAAAPGSAPRAQADLDIFVAASGDAGKSWGAPVRVNDDLVGPSNGQWMPAIAVGPDGAIHVTWLDYRHDPRGERAFVYYAHSTDAARTFSPNVRVSDQDFNGEGGYHQSGAGTIGDYMGLAVSPLAVHPFWADTREGRNDVFTAIIPS